MVKQDLKPHTESADTILAFLSSNPHGLSLDEAHHRLQQYGLNTLPKLKQANILLVFLHRFQKNKRVLLKKSIRILLL